MGKDVWDEAIEKLEGKDLLTKMARTKRRVKRELKMETNLYEKLKNSDMDYGLGIRRALSKARGEDAQRFEYQRDYLSLVKK